MCIIFGTGEINNSVRRWIMRAEGRWFRDTCTCHVFTTLDFTRKRPSFTRECLVRREIPVRMQRREMENVTQPAASPLAEVGKNLRMSLNSFLPRSILVWDRFLSSFVKIGKIYLLVGWLACLVCYYPVFYWSITELCLTCLTFGILQSWVLNLWVRLFVSMPS